MNTTIHKARLHWVEAAGGTFTGRNKLKNTMNDKGALYLHRVVHNFFAFVRGQRLISNLLKKLIKKLEYI